MSTNKAKSELMGQIIARRDKAIDLLHATLARRKVTVTSLIVQERSEDVFYVPQHVETTILCPHIDQEFKSAIKYAEATTWYKAWCRLSAIHGMKTIFGDEYVGYDRCRAIVIAVGNTKVYYMPNTAREGLDLKIGFATMQSWDAEYLPFFDFKYENWQKDFAEGSVVTFDEKKELITVTYDPEIYSKKTIMTIAPFEGMDDQDRPITAESLVLAGQIRRELAEAILGKLFQYGCGLHTKLWWNGHQYRLVRTPALKPWLMTLTFERCETECERNVLLKPRKQFYEWNYVMQDEFENSNNLNRKGMSKFKRMWPTWHDYMQRTIIE